MFTPQNWLRYQLSCRHERDPFAMIFFFLMLRGVGVTATSDHEASRATFFDGRVLLVGDALALFRPYLALSTDQAAWHYLLLEAVSSGNSTVREWEKQALQHAHVTQLKSSALGTCYLSGILVRLYYIFRYILAEVGQRIGVIL